MNNESAQCFLLTTSPNQPSTAVHKMLSETPVTTQLNLENVENFSNVCRICATITEFIMPIFAEEGLQNNLADKINKHLPIQVFEQDMLPLVVCYQCASTLLAWHELVACCQQADAALRACLPRVTGARDTQEADSATTHQKSNTEDEIKNKFEDITGIVVPLDLPHCEESTSSVEPTRKCEFCNIEYEENDYKEHLVTAHADMLFHCEDCDQFIVRKEFIMHMSLHAVRYNNDKSDSKKNRKNKKSDEISTNVDDLQDPKPQEHQVNEFSDHSDTESGFGPLPESVFEAIEDSQDSQPADEETAILETGDSNCKPVENTEQPKIKKYKKTRTCPICSKVYTASSSYFYHIKYSHNKSKDHECDICGKKFGSKVNLVRHGLLHTEECQFECKVCKKPFKSKAGLYIHEQIHNEDKRWSCSQCHKSFRWKPELQRHMKRHSGEKGHLCSICGRGFSIRGDLLRHTRTHTAGNFTCDKCGLKFAQIRYLKVHLNKKHSEEVKESHCV